MLLVIKQVMQWQLQGTSVLLLMNKSSTPSVVGSGHSRGLPHSQMFVSFLEGLLRELANKEFDEKAEFGKLTGEIAKAPTSEEAIELVLHFRLKEVFVAGASDTQSMILVVLCLDPLPLSGFIEQTEPQLVWRTKFLFAAAMRAAGPKMQYGQPPRGVMERALQAQLRRLQRKAGEA